MKTIKELILGTLVLLGAFMFIRSGAQLLTVFTRRVTWLTLEHYGVIRDLPYALIAVVIGVIACLVLLGKLNKFFSASIFGVLGLLVIYNSVYPQIYYSVIQIVESEFQFYSNGPLNLIITNLGTLFLVSLLFFLGYDEFKLYKKS